MSQIYNLWADDVIIPGPNDPIDAGNIWGSGPINTPPAANKQHMSAFVKVAFDFAIQPPIGCVVEFLAARSTSGGVYEGNLTGVEGEYSVAADIERILDHVSVVKRLVTSGTTQTDRITSFIWDDPTPIWQLLIYTPDAAIATTNFAAVHRYIDPEGQTA